MLSPTFRRAGDSSVSGLDHSTTNHAYFYTVPTLRTASIVKSVLFIPLLGLLTIYCADGIRGTIFAIFLTATYHDVLFSAYDALINAAEWTFGSGFAPGCAALTLPFCPAVRAIPGARATVEGDAALTADTRAERSCTNGSDAVIAFGLIRTSHIPRNAWCVKGECKKTRSFLRAAGDRRRTKGFLPTLYINRAGPDRRYHIKKNARVLGPLVKRLSFLPRVC